MRKNGRPVVFRITCTAAAAAAAVEVARIDRPVGMAIFLRWRVFFEFKEIGEGKRLTILKKFKRKPTRV